MIDGSKVVAGDVVIGLPSAGVHANGFTLVRQILEHEDYEGEDLLAPTRLYLDDVRRLREHAHAFAHVTGGGIEGNLRRVIPEGLELRIDWDAWERPPVFEWLARHADEQELRRVFNLGIGYCAVMPAGTEGLVIGQHRVIGVLVSGEGSNLQALIDEGLPIAAVASNRSDAPALARAGAAGIPAAVFPLDQHASREERDQAMADWLADRGVQWVVLAGYMHLLRPSFLERFPERVINVHPALAAGVPGYARDRGCARRGRAGDRRDRALRRRGRGQRAGDRAGARRRSRKTTRWTPSA